jgi:hypothetical protein
MALRYTGELDQEESAQPNQELPARTTGGYSLHKYIHLGEVPPQIRLLTLLPGVAGEPLKGELISVKLQDLDHSENSPKWEALSYCWGDAQKVRPLLIGSEVLEVTESLFVALDFLRHADRSRVIWIDQICVNQRNLTERSQQIHHMRFIYKYATVVTAWLGEGDMSSQIYMAVLCVASQLMHQGLYPATRKPTFQEEALLFSALASDPAFETITEISKNGEHDQTRQYLASLCTNFCNNNWFKRIWIAQEAVLAKNLILQYGSAMVDWNVHSKSCLELLWAEFPSSSLFGSGISLTDTIEMLKNEHYSSARRELFSLVNALKYQCATDPKDRVYALLGLVDPEPLTGKKAASLFPVDYNNTITQLSRDLALWYIENEGTLDVLSICCSGDGKAARGFPSWAIDLHHGRSYCDKLFSSELRSLEIYSAGMRKMIQHRHISSFDALILAGVEFDTIEEVCTSFHQKDLYGVPNTPIWSEWRDLALRPQPDDPYTDVHGRTEAFWRTMITNQTWDDDKSRYVKAPSQLHEQFHHWLSRDDLGTTEDARRLARMEGELGFYDFVNNLLVGNDARLFRTRGGYLGLACEHVRPNDKIVILWGGHLPFLLRECKSEGTDPVAEKGGYTSENDMAETYRLVGGQIYVHGIMEGEGIELASARGFQHREFCIV